MTEQQPDHNSMLQYSATHRIKPNTVNYISGNELAAIIKSDKIPHKDYLVVDVRDDDWAGGNIKNSHNLPSNNFFDNVDGLVADSKDIPTMVFHCALSQVRGPQAARIYTDTRALSGYNKPQEILVLQGGFEQFQSTFKDDADLVENWDADIWAPEI